MKNCYFALFTALLLFTFSGALAQRHIGLATEVLIPLTPFSKGYGVGYGVGFMYRKFEMTRPFIFDVSIGFQRISIKDDPDYLIDGTQSTEYSEHVNLTSFPLKVGFAWAFTPNASPLRQPFAGFDLGYNYAGTRSGGGSIIAALRLGCLIYVQERVLIGVEAKYNTQTHINDRFNEDYTRLAGRIDHQLTMHLSALIRVGR